MSEVLNIANAVAAELGATRNQVVLAWLLAGGGGRSGRTGDLAVPPAWPLVGVSTIGQLDEALDARDLVLGAAARERLDTAA